MRATVTEDGVTIPKRMLEGVSEVEIRKKADGVLVVPLKSEERTTRADIGGQGRLMADALGRIAASGRISGMGDPASWEREARRERPLPGRDPR